jgi:Cys-tRNA(Pro)/Cys-tRNA(Cys) deacylase
VLGDGHGVVVALVPAAAEADLHGIGALLRRPGLRPVAPDQAPVLTGYLLPAVPPVALECDADVVIDECLAEQDVVYTASGEAGVILKVRGADLVKVTDALVFPIAKR